MSNGTLWDIHLSEMLFCPLLLLGSPLRLLPCFHFSPRSRCFLFLLCLLCPFFLFLLFLLFSSSSASSVSTLSPPLALQGSLLFLRCNVLRMFWIRREWGALIQFFFCEGLFYRLRASAKQCFRPLRPLIINASFDACRPVGKYGSSCCEASLVGPVLGGDG